MEETLTISYNVTLSEDSSAEDFMTSFLAYRIAQVLDKFYFPVLVPLGVVGNILSFLVMMQPHNRRVSFSLYISALSVTDTIALMLGFSRFLDVNRLVHFSPKQHNLYCRYGVAVNWTSNMCSTLFILNMTFERFYSIIRPHKAAAFNTVKRAKIIILSCILISVIYNSPHAFITSDEAGQCVPYGKAMNLLIGQIYNWLSYITNFVLPFCLLLFMNSVIIQVLHKRSISGIMKSEEKGHNRSQIIRMKKSERQIFVTLLLVTFGFLILTTPAYAGILYVNFVDFTKSTHSFAQFQLFYSLAQKLYYTNYGINFYLYVISGKKFRTDLINLLEFCKNRTDKDLDFNTESIQSNNDRSNTKSNTDQEIKP